MRIVRHVGGGACPAVAPRTPRGPGSACHAARRCRRAVPRAAPRTRPRRSSASSAGRGSAPAARRRGGPRRGRRPASLDTRRSRPSAPLPPSVVGCSVASCQASPHRLGARPEPARCPRSAARRPSCSPTCPGYTAVAERMDPEAVKSIVDRALRRLGQEVVRYGGRVDKYIGDNVMAVFGAPVSHEDDPERAVRAGLAMQAAMEEINRTWRRPGGGRRQLLAAGRDQLRRGAGRSGGRRLHGDGRRGQRRRPASGGGEAGKRHRRRDHPAPDPGRDRVLRARAADPEGQVRARRGVGGRPRPGSSARPPEAPAARRR